MSEGKRFSYPDRVEAQIRAAENTGAFDNLPGKGRPIPGLGRPRNDLDWVASKLRSEHIDIADVLPPALALAREVERLPERVRPLRSERQVREVVDGLNARIRAALLAPQDGPPMRVGRVDADAVVAQWRAERPRPVRAQPVPEQPAPKRRRWRGWRGWRRQPSA